MRLGWMAAWTITCLCMTQVAWAQEEGTEDSLATSTATTPQNEGFQIDKIELVSGDFSLADRFDAGVSTIDDTHRVNAGDCATYNRETPGEQDNSVEVDTEADAGSASDVDEVSGGTCVLDGDSPIVRVHWSAGFTTSSTGYRWAAKIGSCNAGELTEETDTCFLLTDSVEDIATTGNTFDMPIAWLIGTLDVGVDENGSSRNCCDALSGFTDTVRVHVYTGFENDEATVAYDTLEFAYDYDVPSQPSGVAIQTLGETLRVQWLDLADGEENITYTVYHAADSFDDPAAAESESAGSETELELQNLPLNAERFIRVGAVDSFDNVGELSAEYVAIPAETLDGWEFYKAGGGGEDGGFCFVATAAYGSYLDPHVQVLRDFRDRYLVHSTFGRAFVAFYYAEGASWATWIAERPVVRSMVRLLLVPLVACTGALMMLGGTSFAAISFGAMALAVYSRRRRRFEDATPGSQEMA